MRFKSMAGRHKFRIVASTAEEGSNIEKPPSNSANVVSIIKDDFDRAGEGSLSVGYSQDLRLL